MGTRLATQLWLPLTRTANSWPTQKAGSPASVILQNASSSRPPTASRSGNRAPRGRSSSHLRKVHFRLYADQHPVFDETMRLVIFKYTQMCISVEVVRAAWVRLLKRNICLLLLLPKIHKNQIWMLILIFLQLE